jgi:hypothetical protein
LPATSRDFHAVRIARAVPVRALQTNSWRKTILLESMNLAEGTITDARREVPE